MVMAGRRPSPGGTKSQPRSLTPPSTSNSTSVRLIIPVSPEKVSALIAAVEVARIELAAQAAPEFSRELQRAAERPVVNGRADDLSFVVPGEDGDAAELHAAESLRLPLQIAAQPV